MYGRTCIFQIQSTMPNVLKTNAQLEKGQMPDVHQWNGKDKNFLVWCFFVMLCFVFLYFQKSCQRIHAWIENELLMLNVRTDRYLSECIDGKCDFLKEGQVPGMILGKNNKTHIAVWLFVVRANHVTFIIDAPSLALRR